MNVKTLNKSLKTIFLLSPLLISASAVGSVVNKVDSSQRVSSIGPIKKDDVQLITPDTGNKPWTWHNPNTPSADKVNDRYYRMFFSPASAKYMYNHFGNGGGYNYVTAVTAEPQGSQSKLLDEMLQSGDGFREDLSKFWQMTHNGNNFHHWFVGTSKTYGTSPNIYGDKYNEGDGHQVLGNAVKFHTGAGMFIYCDYTFLAPNDYGVAYGYA